VCKENLPKKEEYFVYFLKYCLIDIHRLRHRRRRNMFNTFDWVEIRTNDMDKTFQFYEELFGWQIIAKDKADGSEVWIFDTGGEPRLSDIRRGGLWQRSDGDPLGVVVYILVEDIHKVLEKVPRLGGEIVSQPVPQNSSMRAYFKDPAGNLFGLWQD
jgi:predicted enzyme related to lactoylglutathione lyase